MAFNYFLMVLCGIYLVYYLAMGGMDIIKMNKVNNDDGHGKDIDISSAVANYKPRVASEVMQKESEEIMAEMEKINSSEDNESEGSDESDVNMSDEGDDFPFNINNSEMFISSADDEDEDESSGSLNIQYDPQDTGTDEYPDVEMNGGYFAANLKGLVDKMNGEENLFAHIKWSAAS